MADQYSLRKKNNRRQGVPQDSRDAGPYLDNKPPKQHRPSQESQRTARSRDGNSPAPDPRVRARPRQNETTANLVKKRYSVRYNQIPDGALDAPQMPGVPQMPQGYANQDRRNGPIEQAPSGGLDKRVLKDPALQADQYVANFLSNASEQNIADYQKTLNKYQSRASTDLQSSVYHNRTQFINISKEAEKLKGEMQSLRGLMAELTTTLGQETLNAESNGSTLDEASRKRANRSSLANLEAMWNTQLQVLWKNIEGSQKFLAAIPGRHVVEESGHWVELDAATWKNRRGVHLVLLNDHLLVAARKPKRIDTNDPNSRRAHTKLVAQRCWPLQEIDLVNVAQEDVPQRGAGGKDQARLLSDALTVRHGAESFTFRSDRGQASDKTELMTAFRRCLDELRRIDRAENKDSNLLKIKETSEYLATRDPAMNRSPGLLRNLSKSKDRPIEILIDVDGKQRNLRWVEGQIDELDLEVALQRFEEAVTHVEQLRKLAKSLKGNAVAQEVINVKVDERAAKLADTLTQNLVATHMHLTPTQTFTNYLSRLDFSSRARQAYLSARSATVRARARQCVFEGDVLAHVTDLAYVYFTLIKNTLAVYTASFPSNTSSACMVWAKGELDSFNEALGRALSGVEKGGEVYLEGIKRAKELAGGLAEVGVDFEALVGA